MSDSAIRLSEDHVAIPLKLFKEMMRAYVMHNAGLLKEVDVEEESGPPAAALTYSDDEIPEVDFGQGLERVR